jgi:hypothetical protein
VSIDSIEFDVPVNLPCLNRHIWEWRLVPTREDGKQKDTRHNPIKTIPLMKAAQELPVSVSESYQLHIDGGANCSITNDATKLLRYQNIRPYYMLSASQDDSIKCTAVGYLTWHATNGRRILVICNVSQQVADTIISPYNIVQTHINACHSWTQYANIHTGVGYIKFNSNDDTNDVVFQLQQQNGL